MAFAFTNDQVERLKAWASVVQLPENQEWYAQVQAAAGSYNLLLDKARFADGSDLTPEQLDELFGYMKMLSHDRALSNLLYKENDLRVFNTGLRTLLLGKESLASRVNQFTDLKWVREVVASHFLCLKDPYAYPFFSKQTYKMLELSEEQEEEASKQSLSEHGITDPAQFNEITLDYLQHLVVFREVKKLLQLESYPLVNVILWDASQAGDEGITAPVPISSISLEKDLRHYIAKNPWVIQRGLELVPDGEEYRTHDPDVGRIDALLRARGGEYYVIETKKDRESDQVVGQIMRYMGWVETHLGKCHGVIVVAEKDERLKYAAVPLLGKLSLKKYEVKFELSDLDDQEQVG